MWPNFIFVVTKTGINHKRPQTTSKPLAKNHKQPQTASKRSQTTANHQQPTRKDHKSPENDHKPPKTTSKWLQTFNNWILTTRKWPQTATRTHRTKNLTFHFFFLHPLNQGIPRSSILTFCNTYSSQCQSLKSFKFICHKENRFLFYRPTKTMLKIINSW